MKKKMKYDINYKPSTVEELTVTTSQNISMYEETRATSNGRNMNVCSSENEVNPIYCHDKGILVASACGEPGVATTTSQGTEAELEVSMQLNVSDMLALRHLQLLDPFVDGCKLLRNFDSCLRTLDPQEDLHRQDASTTNHSSVPTADGQLSGSEPPQTAPPGPNGETNWDREDSGGDIERETLDEAEGLGRVHRAAHCRGVGL